MALAEPFDPAGTGQYDAGDPILGSDGLKDRNAVVSNHGYIGGNTYTADEDHDQSHRREC